MYLKPDLPIARRQDKSLQIGSQAPGCAIIPDASIELENCLRKAGAGIPLEKCGQSIAPDEFKQCLEILKYYGVTTSSKHLQGQARCWQRIDDRLVNAWNNAAVEIRGLHELGLRCALNLVEAGLPAILLRDSNPVDENDLGLYPATAMGTPRLEAAKQIIEQRYGIKYFPAISTSLTIVCNPWMFPYESLPEFAANDTAYLPVCWNETEASVGPIAIPGLTPCARCTHLQRLSRDQSYAIVVYQSSTRPAPRCEALLQMRIAALVSLITYRFFAGIPTATDHGAWHLGIADEVPRFEPLSLVKSCGCSLNRHAKRGT